MPAARHIALVVALSTATGLSLARPADSPKERLEAAKKEYEGEVKTFKRAVAAYHDAVEEAARAKGDKKAVDGVKKERTEFMTTGKLTGAASQQPFVRPMAAARQKVLEAYATAVKDFTRVKMDAEAAAAEKEWQEVVVSSALLIDRKTYLVSLKHYDVKVQNKWFTNNGTAAGDKSKLKLNGEFIPHSILMVPLSKGAAQVRYPLAGRWAAFRTTVGVPTIEDKTSPPASPLTFEVLGDGKSLWKSKPVATLDAVQTCEIDVTNVKVLTLLVHCPDANDSARPMWFEPILIEP